MKKSVFLLALILVTASVQAEVMGIKNLLSGALESSTGTVTGVLTERESEPIRIMTFSEQPVRVTAQVLSRFNEECGRVRLTFFQADALRRDGLREELRYNLDMNVCVDGSPYIPPNRAVSAATPEAWSDSASGVATESEPAMSFSKPAPVRAKAKPASAAKVRPDGSQMPARTKSGSTTSRNR